MGRDMKYKAKSWSDMYGNNLMKSLASFINLGCNSVSLNVPVTSGVTVGWVTFWMVLVQWVGLKHKDLMSNGRVIGQDGEGTWFAKSRKLEQPVDDQLEKQD